MMGTFEWMELQNLTSEITASRSRLSAARRSRDHRLVRALEQEITAAEERRSRLLAHITSHLATGAEEAARPGEVEMASVRDAAAAEPPPLDLVNPIIDGEAAVAVTAPPEASVEGDRIVWDQLTASDIQHAKNELGVRRAEMLARHAEELKALDADQRQLETLEQAIDAFLRKFDRSPGDSALVSLGEERESRLQNRA